MSMMNEVAAEIIAQKHAMQTSSVVEWAEKNGVHLITHGWHLSAPGSGILEDVLNNTTFSIQNMPPVTGTFLPKGI